MSANEICTMCGETDECGCYTEIIHDKCGLDIELCVCKDTGIKWDNDNGVFIVEREVE